MTSFPLLLVPLVPLLIAALAVFPGFRSSLPWAALVAPAPALLLIILYAGPISQDVPALLLGVRLELDATRLAFLAFTAFLWTLAAWSAVAYLKNDTRRTRFCVFFLLAMAGNFGLILAGDVASFYTFFSMMSLASWGLVVHERSRFALFAGRSYIVFAIAGELALFSGLTIAAYTAESLFLADIRQTELGGLGTLLLLLGFGIKLGVVPLHLWLPLAHAAAPAPASAVLSGAMIKAGLFGALTILPFGLVQHEQAGLVIIALGGTSIVLAALIGASQRNPKAVLAYSSVAQMGLVAMALGTGLAVPVAWGAILPALVLFAAHHAFAKAALFLGVPAYWSMQRPLTRTLLLLLLILPAAVLSAAPWTSGALAKSSLKDALGTAPGFWGQALDPVLLFSSLGTALLMLRFLALMGRQEPKANLSAWITGPWMVMTVLALGGVWLAPFAAPELEDEQLANAVPIALAIGGTICLWLLMRGTGLRVREVPPGEILALFQFSRRPTRSAGTFSIGVPAVWWLSASALFQRHATVQRANGGIALLIILVAIIVAGLAAHPDLRALAHQPLSYPSL
ncbi:proton-conducting transporter membrane subunit [Tateyamaria sp. ANG-S1]|uniref:proton-conducting transporter transmembrane domain-containing protein n=1 Tax=Tateyamaria sp. ANG-S1 TaxID=1577905 RepID=UPI00068F5F1A|nr:proton-conducting transporter membrane subunit [Tateyamaria sp. ANG-S1]